MSSAPLLKLLVLRVTRFRAEPLVWQNQPVVGMECTAGRTSLSSFAILLYVLY